MFKHKHHLKEHTKLCKPT
ncbi:unnamed protein product [Acanthoscelides obtectus]|uniref:Uncharacterized protein n=1 Tax=Acanthoscelides obtectus TaxID=200917 RepID=A0A9P0P3S9_ACAOB|nr:unnamed protein product [Acanthoscelides obtectus]CAK1669743.1 hypothetical protein AOBTE_LOCUS27219 [Acanthoscelides obtectus]